MKSERLDRGVTPALESGIEKWGKQVLQSLGSEASFNITNPLVRDYLDAWRAQRIDGITQTTRDQVTRLLQDSIAEGVGVDEMKRRLRREFEGWTSTKAETVARTEVVGSANAANLAAYQISGLVDGKEWVAVPGSDTRETHRKLDGTRIGIRDLFVTENGAAQGPGLFGIAEEDINCRCTLRPVIADLASPVGEARDAEWRAFDASLRPFEDDIKDAFAGVLALWLGDAISAM